MSLLQPLIGKYPDEGEILLLHVDQLVAQLGKHLVREAIGPTLVLIDLLQLFQVVFEGGCDLSRE